MNNDQALTAPNEKRQQMSLAVEQALVAGDLSKLPAEQRIEYYNAVCHSLGLNPLTKPFAYINLNNKLLLYALKDCTEQLRAIHNISITIPCREVLEGVYVVTARAMRPDGRQDESTGAVPIDNLKGEARANAMMKAETKAKRRITLSICGLGMLDETEVETIPGARYENGKQAAAEVAEQKIRQLSAPPQAFSHSGDYSLNEIPPDIDRPRMSAETAALVDTLGDPAPPDPKPQLVKRPTKTPPAIGYAGLERFHKIKAALRDESGSDACYYAKLKEFGYDKSDQIPDAKSAEVVYKRLNKRLIELRSDKVNRAECQEILERIGPDIFWAFAGTEGLDTEAYEQLVGLPLQAFTNKLREEFPA